MPLGRIRQLVERTADRVPGAVLLVLDGDQTAASRSRTPARRGARPTASRPCPTTTTRCSGPSPAAACTACPTQAAPADRMQHLRVSRLHPLALARGQHDHGQLVSVRLRLCLGALAFSWLGCAASPWHRVLIRSGSCRPGPGQARILRRAAGSVPRRDGRVARVPRSLRGSAVRPKRFPGGWDCCLGTYPAGRSGRQARLGPHRHRVDPAARAPPRTRTPRARRARRARRPRTAGRPLPRRRRPASPLPRPSTATSAAADALCNRPDHALGLRRPHVQPGLADGR